MKSTKSFIKYNTLIRVISAIVAAVLIIDFLPINLDYKSVSAATLPTLNVAEKWKNMMEQLGWINVDNSGNYQSSNPSMWKDTSSFSSSEYFLTASGVRRMISGSGQEENMVLPKCSFTAVNRAKSKTHGCSARNTSSWWLIFAEDSS